MTSPSPAAVPAASPEAGAWPRRVAIVSEKLPFADRSGQSEALHGFAAMLRALGAEPHLICLRAIVRPRRRFRMVAGYLAPFASVTIPGTLRRGGDFYVLRPDLWFGAPPPAEAGPPRWVFEAPAPARLRAAGRLLARLRPDLVVANYFNAASVFDHAPPGAARAVFTHDLLALRARSAEEAGLPLDFDPALIAWEEAALRTADLCVTLKQEEADHVAGLSPAAATIVAPFAMPIPPDRPGPALAQPVALFVGTVNRPNVDGLAWLLEAVWPRVVAARPDARLRVVGAVAGALPAEAWPAGAEPVGFVEDLAGEYAGAAVALTPLRFGSGVKIKLVEALAHGAPGVATSVGAEGVAPAPAEALRIADDAQGFAEAILAAFAAPDPAAARAAARETARARFSRDAAGERLGTALAAFAAVRRPPAAFAAGRRAQ